MRHVILLSGKICSGRTTLANRLKREFLGGISIIKTTDIINRKSKKSGLTRKQLQHRGRQLDSTTNGRWIYEATLEIANRVRADKTILVDAVYSEDQIRPFRETPDLRVSHVHLWASGPELQKRYDARPTRSKDKKSVLSRAEADFLKNASNINFLKKDADIRINTSNSDEGDTLVRAAAALGFYSWPERKCVDVVIGGQFGSEGKGNIAAYLGKEYGYLVRVGGPNAGHTVLGAEGPYVYHQLPSGSRDSKAKLIIGPGAVLNIEELLREIDECSVLPERLFIDPHAMIIEPQDIEEEKNLVEKIGSTGRGVGAASARKILGRYPGGAKLAKDFSDLRKYVGIAPNYRGKTAKLLDEAYRSGQNILVEGTQGAGLSIHHGPYPHVTSRDTNVSGCLAEAGIPPARVRHVVLVIRTFPIRVASPSNEFTSGWLKHETNFTKIANDAGLNPEEVEKAEHTSTTKNLRRVGHFDWELFKRSCLLNAPTDIALTFADYFTKENQTARRFEELSEESVCFIEEMQTVSKAPVSIINTCFPRGDRPIDRRTLIDRRTWRGSS